MLGAYAPDGTQVAYARAVTDYSTFAWLCDVYVDEAHRGLGIGKEMVRRMLGHPDLQTLRRWCLATRDAQEVYKAVGFEDVPDGRFLMLRRDDRSWQEPEPGSNR